jgi:hypothetical protein
MERDERLARLAAREGDAEFVAALDAARSHGIPIDALVEQARVRRGFPAEVMLRSGSPALRWMPNLARERWAFPYLDGAAFVGELYRRGGFALVDRMLAHPPTSTAEVLHPERYLRGARAEPVEQPKAISGFRVVERGRMGELGTRSLIESCASPEMAARAAAGWSGDAYAVLEGPRHELALAWRTAWDTVEDAEEFEHAIAAIAPCWDRQVHAPSPDDRWSLDERRILRRKGRIVLVARGLSLWQAADALGRRLRASERRPPDDPPLGPIDPPTDPSTGPSTNPSAGGSTNPSAAPSTNPSPDPSAWSPPGRHIEANRWFISERIGLGAELPEGFRATVALDHELVIEREGAGVALGIVDLVRLKPPRGDWLGAAAAELFAAVGADARLAEVYTGRVLLDGVPGLATTADHGSVGVRVVGIPVCGRRGAWQLVEFWASPSGRESLDRWERSFRRRAGGPACRDLAIPSM